MDELSDYSRGFADGLAFAEKFFQSSTGENLRDVMKTKTMKRKSKRRQSPKQKLLTELTNKKWTQYKKGSGKKTYVQIRAMVSRSQEYKRKAKNL